MKQNYTYCGKNRIKIFLNFAEPSLCDFRVCVYVCVCVSVRERERDKHKYHKKVTVFRDVAPCSLLEIDRSFRGAYCLHHQGDESHESINTSEMSVN
jgi:hypothetical protein